MGTEVSSAKSLAERMLADIQENLGKYLTAEDLAKLVQQAMHEAFFAPVNTYDAYNRITAQPPYFVQMVKDMTHGMVQKEIQKWMAENDEKVAGVIREQLDKGALGMMTAALASIFAPAFQSAHSMIAAQLANKGIHL